MKKHNQYQWEQVAQMMQQEGWAILVERLGKVKQGALEEYARTDEKKEQAKVMGIDLLFEEIMTIKNQSST